MATLGSARDPSPDAAASEPTRNDAAEVLTRRDCLRLLADAPIGRLAVGVGIGDRPAVVPLRFAVTAEVVVFPVAAGSDLEAAIRNTVVAFEVDDAGPAGGWSVLVTGVATEMTGPGRPRLSELLALDETSGPQRIFGLGTEVMSGRSLPRTPMYLGGLTLTAPSGNRSTAPPGVWDVTRSDPIPADECLRLLANEEVGRLIVTVTGRPQIFPVNYALDGDAIVFRTAPGTKLHAAGRSPVVFQVDSSSGSAQPRWSVVVEGVAQEVTSGDAPNLRNRLTRLPLYPLAGGARLVHYVRIVPLSVNGSRFLATPAG
jgi:nitroimidazol reductase NimA-like FMN-containing flavoprotein (pyridoxamine 5'-phosphate oxidase superfamily)